MSNLSIAELIKPGREWRAAKILEKIKDRTAFELSNGSKAVLTATEDVINILSDISKIKSQRNLNFTDSNGNQVPLTKIKKSKEFGGGGGSGAGAEVTSIAESAQAVYAQALYSFGSINDNNLEKAYKLSNVSATLEQIKSLPDDWIESSILGASIIRKNLPKQKVSFHRQSTWVKGLEKHFSNLNKQHNSVFSDINKWSPADIYMISDKGLTINFANSTSLNEFNSILAKALADQDIVGISLKKIVGNGSFKYYNVGEKKKEVKYTGYTLGKTGFFNSKDAFIFFTVDGSIQFRTFPSFQGEIKGKNAAQGKIGYGSIAALIRLKLGVTAPDISTTRASIKRKDPKFFESFFDLYIKYSNDSKKVDKNEFVAMVSKLGDEWMLSKYMGSKLIELATTTLVPSKYRTDKSAADIFISSIIEYASSTSDLSGPYAKIE